MSNVISSMQINGNNPVSVSGIGTAVKYFPTPLYPPQVPSMTNGYVLIPGGTKAYSVNGQILSVDACGDFVCPSSDATSPAVTIGLYQSSNPQATSPTINTLFSYQEPSTAPGVVPVPFSLHADLHATNVSGLLQGNYRIQIDNGTVQTGAITSVAGVSFAANPSMGLLVGITFSQSGSGNSANLYEFQVSA